MMGKCSAIAACALVLFSSRVWAGKDKVPKECLTRNPALSEAACEARLSVGAPILPECNTLKGRAYRVCAASMPSDEDLEEGRGMARKEAEQHASAVTALKAVGINLPQGATRLPTPQEAASALNRKMQAEGKTSSADEIQKAYNNARAAEIKAVQLRLSSMVDPDELSSIFADEHAAQVAEQRAKECPYGLRIGDKESQVYACLGLPDHTNSDSRIDQLVYSNGTYVYIDRSTDRVEDIQTTH